MHGRMGAWDPWGGTGFLRAQLARGGAAGLARWFLQLKRLEAAASQEVEDEDEDEGKGALLATLRSERRVFDVLYARGERARDVRSALDQAGALEGPAEVLSFSSRASGAVCRVTCECAGRELAVTSSLFLPEALERLQELLRAGADVDAAVDAVVDALNSSQVSLLKPAP